MDIIFKNNTYKILELFIEFPTIDFSVRGIARKLDLSHATVLKYIEELQELSLIKKKKETLYPTYYANTENSKYKFYKRNWFVFKLTESGLIDFIQKQTFPSSIVLFGSGAKATFTDKSDVDIFVEAKESRVYLSKYEKKLNRKINLLFEPNINNLSKELRNNIINGVILYGFIKINREIKNA
jgi:predicted nucleotidyltransferase